MAVRRNKNGGQPSPYLRIPFHGLRSAQLLSSIIVTGIMGYFIHYLHDDNLPIPWTFIVLLCISVATILTLTITIFLYNFTYLSPRVNIVLNGSLLAFWILGFGLLSSTVAKNHMLSKACTPTIWGGSSKASICKDYKSLWGMTFVGTISTVGALFLDIFTQQKGCIGDAYTKHENDEAAWHLTEHRVTGVPLDVYDAPAEQNLRNTFGSDTGYHNRYGIADKDSHSANVGPRQDIEFP